MAKYRVEYNMRKDNATQSGKVEVSCEEERTAMEMAQQQAESKQPGYTFSVRKITKLS